MTVRHKRSKRNRKRARKRARKVAEAAQIQWILRINPFLEFDIEEGLEWRMFRRKSGRYLGCRRPEETFRQYSAGKAFSAAGKMYTDEQQLRVWGREIHTDYDFEGCHDRIGSFLDRYGRKVAFLAEKMPGYDDCDRNYDNRFYRCYFLSENEKLTCISFADGSDWISVTEDMASIPYARWKTLKEQNWILQE